MHRVVVTGLGAVASLGHDVETLWSRLIGGESGLRRITRFDTSAFASSFAGEIAGFEPTDRDRCTEFAYVAAHEALSQSGANAREAAVLVGTAFGGVESLANGRVDHAFAWLAASAIAEMIASNGPVLTYQASFTGAANAIGEGLSAFDVAGSMSPSSVEPKLPSRQRSSPVSSRWGLPHPVRAIQRSPSSRLHSIATAARLAKGVRCSYSNASTTPRHEGRRSSPKSSATA